MTTFYNLPVELIIEIINCLRPQSKDLPVIGVNAAWTNPDVFLDSLWLSDPAVASPTSPIDAAGGDNVDSTGEPAEIAPKIYAYSSLLALRATSSYFNKICVPLLYQQLNVLKESHFSSDLLDIIVIPHSQHIKTLRICLDVVTDEETAKILKHTRHITSLLLYRSYLDRSRYEFNGKWTWPKGDWLANTRECVVDLLESGSLEALGLYSQRLMVSRRRTWGTTDENDAVPLLLKDIAANSAAKTSLKKLELCLGSLHPPAFDLVRSQFNSIESLTLHYMLRKGSLNFLWDPKVNQYWSRYDNLTNLQLRKCHKSSVPFVPHMVRQFTALQHLLISVCGLSSESQNAHSASAPLHRRNWYDAEHALWKVHQPLETFQIKHGNHWDIDCLGEIPVRKVIFTNFCGSFFVKTLKEDSNANSNSNSASNPTSPSQSNSGTNSSSNSNFFPFLEVMWIQSEKKEHGLDGKPYTLASLEEFCRRRNIALRRDTWDLSSP